MHSESADRAAVEAMAARFEALRAMVVGRALPRTDPGYRDAVARMEARARLSAFKVGDIVYRWHREDRALLRIGAPLDLRRPRCRPTGECGGPAEAYADTVRVYRRPAEWGASRTGSSLGISG